MERSHRLKVNRRLSPGTLGVIEVNMAGYSSVRYRPVGAFVGLAVIPLLRRPDNWAGEKDEDHTVLGSHRRHRCEVYASFRRTGRRSAYLPLSSSAHLRR